MLPFGKNKKLQSLVTRAIDFAAISATGTLFLMPTFGDFELDRADLLVTSTATADASNYVKVDLMSGAVILATWSVQTGQQGTIAANTFVQMVNQALANRRVAVAGTLKLVFTKNGTGALAAGTMVLHGRYRSTP